MDVGIQMIFASAGWGDVSDTQLFRDKAGASTQLFAREVLPELHTWE